MSEAPIEIGPIELSREQPSEPSTPAPDPRNRQRSRMRAMVLTPLVAIAGLGLAALAWASWQVVSQKDAQLATPPQIGGLRLDDTEEGRSTAEYLKTALSAEVDLDEAVGGIYRDGQGKNVLLFGGTALFWTPEDDLDTAFNLISDKSGAVTGLHEVSAGKLGGTMKCGTTKADGGELPVCGWADHGSMALAMFPSRTAAEAPALMGQIRDAVESR